MLIIIVTRYLILMLEFIIINHFKDVHYFIVSTQPHFRYQVMCLNLMYVLYPGWYGRLMQFMMILIIKDNLI